MAMDESVTIFDVPTRKLKEVQRVLSALDLEAARAKIDALLANYPDHELVHREALIVQFLQETLTPEAKPPHLFGRFSAFRKLLKELSYTPDYFADLERTYYGRVVDAFAGSPLEPIYGYPPGYLLFKAGRFDQARESLLGEVSQASLPSKRKAHLLGYLGDLFEARGEIEEARRYYAQAILADWSGIDTKALLDEDVKALILGTYIPEGMGGAWSASVGHILMVFPPRGFRDSDELMNFFKDFNRLRLEMQKEQSEETAGRLFYGALIMVENEMLFRSLKGADMLELRKLMRTINPALYRFYNKATLARRENADILDKGR
jgi:tetratricopeptide (TPR) repeat protein